MPEPFETLKQILRHARNPGLLDDHPWTQSLFVREAVLDSPQLQEVPPGQQLIGALARLFPQVQPATPPRHGKRLDPRWGEFGLLAALYFTPFNHGTSYPSSLMEAWARIDPAILYFVYGRPAETLCQQDIKKFELVGANLEYGAASTLSDWHKKGLQRFAELVLNRERCIARNQSRPSILLEPARANAVDGSTRRRAWRWAWLAFASILLLALGLGAFKSWKVYGRARAVYQDVTGLQHLAGPLSRETVEAAVPRLVALQTDLAAFKAESRPFLLLAPKLDWVPAYGGDLAAAPALIDLAEHLLDASLLSAQAAGPLLEELDSQASALDPGSLTALLVQAQPGLAAARRELDAALAARGGIDAGRLSPPLQGLVVEELDPMLKLADEGLSLSLALPGMLGAGKDGPRTYLLLAQNEDELRPTGGFITSVGNLVLHNGEVIRLDFEGVDSEMQEDWSRPYPAAPWQLQEYMDSRVLILRDANWFTDFPTTAMWVEYLYAYTHAHSVDGMIAFDQRLLVMLLGELGPLTVEDAPYPLTADNVIEYMRQAKAPPEEPASGWYRKEFISEIAAALLAELTNGESHDWRGLLQVLSRALAERHLLLQFDDPVFAALAAERGWDGALRPAAGDFLMVADTNIGFNKTSAVVDASLAYAVDLTDPVAPESTLTVTHRNNASPGVPCIPGRSLHVPGNAAYPIDRCYWTYLRAYKQAGAALVDSLAHNVPGGWTLLGEPVPPRVDILEEELEGVQGFGTLLVVPGGKSLNTSFKFGLPAAVLSSPEGRPGELTYRLRVQKQPGTLAVPLAIRIHLPNGAAFQSVPAHGLVQDQDLLLETDLRTDVEIVVTFTVP